MCFISAQKLNGHSPQFNHAVGCSGLMPLEGRLPTLLERCAASNFRWIHNAVDLQAMMTELVRGAVGDADHDELLRGLEVRAEALYDTGELMWEEYEMFQDLLRALQPVVPAA